MHRQSFIEIHGDGGHIGRFPRKHILYNDRERVRQQLQDGDVFVVVYGFIDCISALAQFGYKTHMLALLPKSERQLMTEKVNKTRLTAAVRWVVESRYEQIKQFRFFDKVIPTTLL